MKISFRRSACTIAAAILLPVTHAQGSPDLSGLLSILNSTPEGTWVQVNLNSYSEAWTPAELRPLYLTSNPDPSKITYAWPSFAWDSNRGDLILYGGGHANYSGNDVYRWHGTTRKWERAALPSELLLNPPGFYTPIDGPDAGPPSSHTYDNSLFLPIIDRFIVFGGAAFNTGGPYNRMNPDGVTYRNTGPYLFDPSKADPNKVGGTTGSHVKRVAPHPEIVGGNMWTNRDYRAYTFTGSTLIPNSHINGVTAYAQENGKDVVHFGARPGQGTDQHLFKYTISSLTDVTQDKLEKVGRFWNGPSDQGAGTYDPTRKLFVRTGPATQPITYWDLNNASPSNNDVVTVPVDASGTFDFNQMRMTGIDYDPTTDQYLIWYGGPDVWRLTPPTPVTSTGWKLDKVSKTSSAAPTIDADSRGILGKWKFIPNLNAFLGLQDFVNGNIWLFKPVGWKLPTGTGNLPPTVSLTSPSAGASFTVGSIVSVTATASDSDGSVTQVAFYVDGGIATTSSGPTYTANLSGLTAGTHSLTAVATDNAGAITTSAAVSITVTSATNTPPTVSLTSPAAGASFTAGSAVTVTATAADTDGSVAQVAFYVDGSLAATSTAAPYSASLTSLTAGTHSLTAVATDNAGATTTSAAVSITVTSATNTPPTVSLTSPTAGASFTAGSAVTVSATAADTNGSVTQVAFYVDGSLAGTLTAAPYSLTLSSLAAGAHSVYAVATDNAGASTTSTTVSFSVTSGSTGGSTSVTLQDGTSGYAGTADTFLTRWGTSENHGADATLLEGGAYVDLVRFAIFQSEGGPVPNGATITSAKLSLYKTTDYNYTYTANRMLADWTETGATWNSAKAGVAWAAAGAASAGVDYLATADATASVSYSPGWLSFDVTSGVQALATGLTNRGWRLVQVSGNSNEKRFASREYATASLRPKLEITYSTGSGTTNTPPTVSLTSPAAGASFTAGSAVTVTATAADTDGSVAQVAFYVDGSLAATSTAAPYSASLTGLTAGTHSLTAVATDNAGATTTSAAVSITVTSATNTPPTVSLTSPTAGASFTAGSAVTVSATAADTNGSVTQVAFYVDGSLAGTLTAAPYSLTLSSLAAGAHSVYAVATDNAGASTTSTTVSFSVTSGSTGGSTSVTLQDGTSGYAGTADTFLTRWGTSENHGADATLLEGGAYVDLVRFAIFQSEGGPVPNGATITSAKLSLYKTTDYNYTYTANRMLADWTETGATWNSAKAGVAWGAAGAASAGVDYLATADATASVSYSPGWLSFDVTSGVQALATGLTNRGWRLVQVSGNSNEKRFASREYATASLRPKLEITFTP